MSGRFKTNFAIALTTFVVTCIVMLFMLREPTVPLTQAGLADARVKWAARGVADYNLEYLMNGNACVVTVRNGIVTSLLVNGAEGQSSQLKFYSVDGLFDTLEMDIETLADRSPKTILMRVRFNAQYGYVERYVRSSSGVAKGADIESMVFLVAQPSHDG